MYYGGNPTSRPSDMMKGPRGTMKGPGAFAQMWASIE